LPEVYDEPFADPSQLPTMLLSQVTRRDVTVALSGDGGDEVFAGYNRYVLGRRILSPLDHLPRVVRAGVGRLVLRVPPHWWDESAALLPKRIGFRTAGDKARKLGELLTARGAEERYRALVSQWPREAIVDGVERASILSEPWRWPSDLSETEVMNFLDTAVGLPDDMLVKVDRASMSASLEVRTPFLDHRVLEFAWSLPLDMRIRNRQGKWLVRRMLDRYIPRALIDRPKMGFDPPLGEWLRGPLRDWAETLISPERLRAHGHIDPSAVRRVWEDHLARRRN
jgi:asparagine synthase (glutamine-hydrolysing)